MKIISAKDVPTVAQTDEWKGLYELHYMSLLELIAKYPPTNKFWTVSYVNWGHFYAIHTGGPLKNLSDPWHREFPYVLDKYHYQVETKSMPQVVNGVKTEIATTYTTTVESNLIRCLVYGV